MWMDSPVRSVPVALNEQTRVAHFRPDRKSAPNFPTSSAGMSTANHSTFIGIAVPAQLW